MPLRKSKRATPGPKLRRPAPTDTPQPRRNTGARPRAGKAEHAWGQRAEASVLRFIARDGSVAVDAVAKGLGVTRAALASALGLAEETLQRTTRSKAPKTQQRLRDMLEILCRVEPWAGSLPQALGWYRGQGIPALGYQTAESLVKHGQADSVRGYLDGLAAGAFA